MTDDASACPRNDDRRQEDLAWPSSPPIASPDAVLTLLPLGNWAPRETENAPAGERRNGHQTSCDKPHFPITGPVPQAYQSRWGFEPVESQNPLVRTGLRLDSRFEQYDASTKGRGPGNVAALKSRTAAKLPRG
jgi:hypothetical protein